MNNVTISFNLDVTETDSDEQHTRDLGNAYGLVNLPKDLLGEGTTREFMNWLLVNSTRLMLNESLEKLEKPGFEKAAKVVEG